MNISSIFLTPHQVDAGNLPRLTGRRKNLYGLFQNSLFGLFSPTGVIAAFDNLLYFVKNCLVSKPHGRREIAVMIPDVMHLHKDAPVLSFNNPNAMNFDSGGADQNRGDSLAG
jgi:hypothetical protein